MLVSTACIVYRVWIRSFGLEKREIREIAEKVVKEEFDTWSIGNVEKANGVEYILEIVCKVDIRNFDGDSFDALKNRVEEVAKKIEMVLEVYRVHKEFIQIYNNNNGHNGGNKNSEHLEIMERLGIPVIS